MHHVETDGLRRKGLDVVAPPTFQTLFPFHVSISRLLASRMPSFPCIRGTLFSQSFVSFARVDSLFAARTSTPNREGRPNHHHPTPLLFPLPTVLSPLHPFLSPSLPILPPFPPLFHFFPHAPFPFSSVAIFPLSLTVSSALHPPPLPHIRKYDACCPLAPRPQSRGVLSASPLPMSSATRNGPSLLYPSRRPLHSAATAAPMQAP